jgi:hypothetical protein
MINHSLTSPYAEIQVISFLHRMIEILGLSVLPCIPIALRLLLLDNEVFQLYFNDKPLFSWFFCVCESCCVNNSVNGLKKWFSAFKIER